MEFEEPVSFNSNAEFSIISRILFPKKKKMYYMNKLTKQTTSLENLSKAKMLVKPTRESKE